MHTTPYIRTYARIRLDAIRANFDALKSGIPAETNVIATVKANGYGHGAVAVAKALSDRADYFAVATVDEAVELREHGISHPLLVLSYTHPSQFQAVLQHHIIATLFSWDDAVLLSATAQRLGQTATVHLAVDTGMTRIGFTDTAESADTIARIAALPHLNVEGIFTHFACADTADTTTAREQKRRFDAFLAALDARGVVIPVKHASNSAATVALDAPYDAVRLGIALYGVVPSHEMADTYPTLQPAMEVVSHIIHIHDVDAGVGVGYGHTYHTPSPRRIATVAIGYADGFNRAFSNRGSVLIGGKRAPVVGRVCMDQIMVDVTDIPCAAVGEEAVILGRNGDECITAEELGALCDSFHYEVLCNFMPRVTRIYE